MSGTNEIHVRKPLDMQSLPLGALELIWTGNPTGVFSVQASLGPLFNGDAWRWYPTGTAVKNPAGVPGNSLVNLGFPAGFRYLGLIYTNVSGAGLLTVNGMAKAGAG